MSSSPELSKIVCVLKPIENRFFELGMQLEIDHQQLKSIEDVYRGNQSRCLIETIKLWQDNSIDECSWSALAMAVERIGGHRKLAKELKERDPIKPAVQQPTRPQPPPKPVVFPSVPPRRQGPLRNERNLKPDKKSNKTEERLPKRRWRHASADDAILPSNVTPSAPQAVLEVVRVLRPIADKSLELGANLGIRPQKLRRISLEERDNSRHLIEIISLWQKRNSGDCIWSALAEAVKKIGGHNRLVKELMKRALEEAKPDPASSRRMGTQVQRPLRNDNSSDVIAASIRFLRPGVEKKKRFSSESDIIEDPLKGYHGIRSTQWPRPPTESSGNGFEGKLKFRSPSPVPLLPTPDNPTAYAMGRTQPRPPKHESSDESDACGILFFDPRVQDSRRYPPMPYQRDKTKDVVLPFMQQQHHTSRSTGAYNTLSDELSKLHVQWPHDQSDSSDEDVVHTDLLDPRLRRSPYLSRRSAVAVNPEYAYKLLLPVAHQWQIIGELLNISDRELAMISLYEQGTLSCLREMLNRWSKQAYPPPTWSALADAVSLFDPRIEEKLRNL